MPIEYISFNQTTTHSVQSSDDVFLLADVDIYTVDDAIEANFSGANNGITITVQGGLYGETAIDLWENSTENNDIWIYIGSEGHLHATEDAIAMRQGDDNNVVNYGEITAQQAGVYFQGGEATLVNHGVITSFGNGGQGAVIFNATADGSNVRELTNTGIIYGAPQSTGTSFYSTIQNSSGDEFHLNNSGSILADGARAVFSSATETFFENTGLIDGEVVMTGVTEMFNSGTINGDVTLSSSADLYQGAGNGVVSGELNLNSGDDTAYMGNAGGVVLAGSGDDTVFGGSGLIRSKAATTKTSCGAALATILSTAVQAMTRCAAVKVMMICLVAAAMILFVADRVTTSLMAALGLTRCSAMRVPIRLCLTILQTAQMTRAAILFRTLNLVST